MEDGKAPIGVATYYEHNLESDMSHRPFYVNQVSKWLTQARPGLAWPGLLQVFGVEQIPALHTYPMQVNRGI